MNTDKRWILSALFLTGLLSVPIPSSGQDWLSDLAWMRPMSSGSSVAYSPDGQVLAVDCYSERSEVALVRASDGRYLRAFSGGSAGNGASRPIVFAPNSKVVAWRTLAKWSLGRVSDCTVLWSITSGWNGTGGDIAFSPDSQLIALGYGAKGDVVLYRASDGASVLTLPGHFAAGRDYYIAFAPDGQSVVTSDGQAVRFWKISDGSLLATWPGGASRVAVSPNGELVATLNSDLLRVRRRSDASVVWTQTHGQNLNYLAFLADGSRVATSDGSTIFLWQSSDGKPAGALKTPYFAGIAFSPDAQSVAVTRSRVEYPLELLRTADGNRLWGYQENCWRGWFSADGSMILGNTESYPSQSVAIFRTTDGSFVRRLEGHQETVTCTASSLDGQFVASGGSDGTVIVWRVTDGTIIRSQKIADHISSIAFTADGQAIVATTQDDTGFMVRIFRISDGIVAWEKPDALAIVSRDGRVLATSDQTGKMQFWALPEGRLISEWQDEQARRFYLGDMSSDGQYLAACAGDTVYLFRASDGKEMWSGGMPFYRTYTYVRFCDAGRLIAHPDTNGIALRRVSDGSVFRTLSGAPELFSATPDGRYLLIGKASDWQGKVWYLWPVPVTGAVNRPPDAPILVVPEDKGTVRTLSSAFQVQATDPDQQPLQYKVELLRAGETAYTFDQTQSQTGWDQKAYASGKVATLTMSGIAAGEYQWRAQAYDGWLWGPWSETRTFTYITPSAPTLLSPDDSATIVSYPLNLQINATDPQKQLLKYKIEFLQSGRVTATFDQTASPDGWDKESYGSGETATRSLSLGELASGTYQWRAFAYNGGEWGPASPTRTVTLQGADVLPFGQYTLLTIRKDATLRLKLSVPATERLFVSAQPKERPFKRVISLLRGNTAVAADGTESDCLLQTTNPPAGEYALKVDGVENGTLLVRADKDLPDVKPGETFIGNIQWYWGVDWAQMDVPDGADKLDFTLETPGNIARLEVWREAIGGSEYWKAEEQYWASPYKAVKLTIPSPKAGRYYLRMHDHGIIQGGSQVKDYSLMATMRAPVSRLTKIAPDRAGNTGNVTVTIAGNYLNPAMIVALTQSDGTRIDSLSTTFSTDGNTLAAVFDLTGSKPGRYHIHLAMAGQEPVLLNDAFTIEHGGEPRLWCEVLGRSVMRSGRISRYQVIFGNAGTTNLPGGYMAIKLDEGLEPLKVFDGGTEIWNAGSVPIRPLGVWIANLAPGQKLEYQLDVLAPIRSADHRVIPIVSIGLAIGGGIVVSEAADLWSDFVHEVISRGHAPGDWSELWDVVKTSSNTWWHGHSWVTTPPQWTVEGALGGFSKYAKIESSYLVNHLDQLYVDTISYPVTPELESAFFKDAIKLADRVSPLEGNRIRIIQGIPESTKRLDALRSNLFRISNRAGKFGKIIPWIGIITDVIDFGKPLVDLWRAWADDKWTWSKTSKQVSIKESLDPNEIVGPTGIGDNYFVTHEVPLQYAVYFENLETASAAAQEVVVTDRLDPAKYDLTTFSLGPMAFGDKQSVPETGMKEHVGFVDLRPAKNLVVRMEAKLEASTGLVTWKFTSLDPATGDLTTDPVLGFLPPNKDGAEGQGSVQFSVMPKKNLPSGTEITNQARIVFDVNAPIDTNVWKNTLDSQAATSRVKPLPDVSFTGRFPVEWEGSDDANGSGLQGYTVYVSDNGGAFTPWIFNTTDTSATYAGKFGHTYRFYAVATDKVGNREAKVDQAEAGTRAGQTPSLPAGLHMVSVPVQSETSDPKAVFAFEGNQWARYDPTANSNAGGYVLYDRDPQGYCRFEEPAAVPGRAYWTRLPQAVTPAVMGALTDETLPFVLPLKKGWNQVGNPFLAPLTWDLNAIQVRQGVEEQPLAQAAEKNWIDAYAWRWNAPEQRYELIYDRAVLPGITDTLPAWEGAWVYAKTDCALVFPAKSDRAQTTRKATSTGDGWSLRLQATTSAGSGEAVLGATTKGKAVAVSRPPDPLGREGRVRVALVRDDRRLAADICSGGGTQSWEVEVQVPPATPTPDDDSAASTMSTEVTLRWPDVHRLPRNANLTILDLQAKQTRYLKTSGAYTFQASGQGGTYRFRVESLPRSALLRITDARVSGGRVPGAPYRISFVLNRDAQVQVRVLSGGRLVRQVAGRTGRAADIGQILWDGKDQGGRAVPAGAYMVDIKAITPEGQVARAVVPVLVVR